MSSMKFVRPSVGADGAVLVVRHPKTKVALPADGVAVDFADIDVRTFFTRREREGDVSFTDAKPAPAANETNTKRASAKGGDAS